MGMNVLFLAAEYDGLVKIGGLADIAASLPAVLGRRGHQVRVLLPFYGCIGDPDGRSPPVVAQFPGGVLREWHPRSRGVRVWLLDLPQFRRRAHPYQTPDGGPWPEDVIGWGAYGRLAAAVAADRFGLGWRADVIHANDWMTGLAPVYAQLARVPSATVFTIHSLAQHGLFQATEARRLELPGWVMHPEALEFHGQLSFIKGGLMFSDRLTAVSPRYAEEIRTHAYGEGLDGVFRMQTDRLSGILNGIDTRHWDPRRDAAIAAGFGPGRMQGRRACREALLREAGLSAAEDTAIVTYVGRLAHQKGVDLLLAALPHLLDRPLVLIVLGRGELALEQALGEVAWRHPGRVTVRLLHDEGFARRVFAGADLLLMPSRFEPCGLTQMYAMRYGTVPVARAVGGLRDTITDPADAPDAATGFLYAGADADALTATVDRALHTFAERARWDVLVRNGMRRDFSWGKRAVAYETVYAEALGTLRGPFRLLR